MPPPTVQQHQGLVRAQTPQGERAADVPSVGDALVREVYRGGELLQDLARLRRPRPLDVLGREDVHRHRQLLRCCVPRPRADRHVDGRELDGLSPQREVLPRRLRSAYGHAHGLGDVTEQPCAHGVRPGGNAPELIVSFLVRCRARAECLDADGHAPKRRARAVGHVPPDDASLREKSMSGCEQEQDRAERELRRTLSHNASSGNAYGVHDGEQHEATQYAAARTMTPQEGRRLSPEVRAFVPKRTPGASPSAAGPELSN